MRYIQIPESFLKAIAEKGKSANGKMYSRLWFYWLSEYVDEIFEEDFLEKQIKALPKVNSSEISEIYKLGIHLLRADEFKIIEKKAKKTKITKPMTRERKTLVAKVIEYLNEKTGTSFETTGVNVELICARADDGYGLDDFKVVIDKKVYDWKGSDQQIYLRPKTLFAKSNFENYLNELSFISSKNDKQYPAASSTTSKFHRLSDSASKAKQLIGFFPDKAANGNS